MKILVMLFISQIILGQVKSRETLQKQLSSLEFERAEHNAKIIELDNEIAALKEELYNSEIAETTFHNDYGVSKFETSLWIKPDINSTILSVIPKGDSILIYEMENTYYKAEYKQKVGYVWCFDFNSKFEKKHREKWKVKKNQLEELKTNEYRANILKDFGKINGQKILDGVVWIGMTDLMALHSWGKPLDINKTTTQRGTDEQWVYGNGKYLYFENGILTTIQD